MEINGLAGIGTAIIGLVAAVTLALKAWLPGYLETVKQTAIEEHRAEIEAEAYERNRRAFREDKSFEILETLLNDLQEERNKDREEARQERELSRQLIATIDTLGRNVSRNTDIVRILAQNSAKLDDRLSIMEARLQRNNTQRFDGGEIAR